MDKKPIKRKKSNDVYLIGRYFCDLVFTGLPEMPRLGHEVYCNDFRLVPGGASNPAIALSRLGLNVVWPCEFGTDPFSQYVKAELIKEGVNQEFFTVSENPSIHITVSFSFHNDRSFLSYMDPVHQLPHEVFIKKANPRWVYISYLMIGDEQKEVVFSARDAGAKIFMDCQAHNKTLADDDVITALKRVDVFSPNAEEALTLTGENNIFAALNVLAKIVPLVIIKNGSDGCVACQAGKISSSKAISVNVKDTTGAGDNFNCGFLLGQIKNLSLVDSLQTANICAGLSTRGYGGSEASPCIAELSEWIQIK